MKKIIFSLTIIFIFSCSLDPYGEGPGKNSTGNDNYVSCRPGAVSGIRVTENTISSVEISWNATANATSYNIYKDEKLMGSTKGTSFNITGLYAADSYHCKITAVNSCGESVVSTDFTACTKPYSPNKLSVSLKSDGSAEISWNTDWKIESCNIYRSQDSSEFVLIGSTIGPSFIDTAPSNSKINMYKVTAVTPCTESEMSYPVRCISLSEPSIISAKVLSPNSVEITFNKVKGARDHSLQRATSTSGIYTHVAYLYYSDSLPVFTDKNLAVATTYYYKITVENDCDKKESPKVSVKTALNAPSRVTAEAVSVSNIDVMWKKVDDAVQYNVYRALDYSEEYILVGSTGDTLFNDEALSVATTYYYKVSAVNDEDAEGDLSQPAYATTKSCTEAPAVTSGLSALTLSPTSIKISWDEVYAATSYIILASTSDTGDYSQLGTVQRSLSYTDADLSSSKTYFYKVVAQNDCGKSDTSVAVSATTQDCGAVILPPQNVSALTYDETRVALSWSKVDGAVSYRIYRSNSQAGLYSLIESTDDTEFIITIPPLAGYFYKITALTQHCGESEMSMPACGPTPRSANNFRAFGNSPTSIRVEWSKVDEASGYETFRSESQTGEFKRVSFNVELMYFIDRDVVAKKTYYYKQTAANVCGQSDFTKTVSATVLNE